MSRDFRWREKKKQKKGTKKVVSIAAPQPTATVEVVKKKREPKEAEEE